MGSVVAAAAGGQGRRGSLVADKMRCVILAAAMIACVNGQEVTYGHPTLEGSCPANTEDTVSGTKQIFNWHGVF